MAGGRRDQEAPRARARRWSQVIGARRRRYVRGRFDPVAVRPKAVNEVLMDVVEKIKAGLGSSPVVLFMKGTPDFPQCGFSAQTVAALRALGADFKHVNIFEEPEIREALKRYSNWPTYPQLYVKGELIGGCDIALEMLKSGELKKLMSEAGAAQ